MKLRVADEDEPGINLTPMVDVVFNLLVFFMLATTFAERERLLDLELPFASATNTRAPEPRELVINVARDGAVWIDGRSLQGEELTQVLSEAAARDARTLVTIRGDRRGYYDEIVRVLDVCMQAGLENVSLGALTDGQSSR